ncbi:hypothetical protein EDB84DRAFT_1441869 [Lactarius hengduanensis]|nr:hypothetical protein EDB84DRAFT_1441869 [Lactarius hengduanensis]
MVMQASAGCQMLDVDPGRLRTRECRRNKPRENAARPRANAALWGMLGMMVRVVYGYGWFTGFAGPDVTACRHYANCQRVNTQPPWLLRHPTLQVSARRLLCSGPGNSQEAKCSHCHLCARTATIRPWRRETMASTHRRETVVSTQCHDITDSESTQRRNITASTWCRDITTSTRHHDSDAAPRHHGIDVVP